MVASQDPEGNWRDPWPPDTMRLKTDGTLMWGSFNNLRPFAIMMSSARLENGSLVGSLDLRG
jgi:hypothetical protein